MMAGHRRQIACHSHRLAKAMRALSLGSTRHRQRPEGRDEHDQQQESSSPAVSSPHVSEKHTRENQLPVLSSQFPPLRSQALLRTGNWQLIYHFIVHPLAVRLLKTIREQQSLRAGDRVAAAVSGGADSVALLRLLVEVRSELGIVLSVVHVNHKLRGEESDSDELFVRELALHHGLEFHLCEAPLDLARSSGIEAAARKLRYDFFRRLARQDRIGKFATAHTIDDQAETVLLRILRGTGIRGLSSIHPRLVLQDEGEGEARAAVIRPLLQFRRIELQEFLRERGQVWREDSSNRDLGFLRNRVRHVLLPVLLENFGAGTVENLADLAEIARAEAEEKEEQSERVEQNAHALPLEPGLLSLPLAASRRMVRDWLEASAEGAGVSFRLIEEILKLARGPAGKKIELPGGHTLCRTQTDLHLEPAQEQHEPANYEYALPVPGQIEIRELGIHVEAVLVDSSDAARAGRDGLLNAEKMPTQFILRNWRPGDRFWPAHTANPKKVKELLSDRHATGREKRLWPVAVAEGCGLVWMRGFAVPEAFRAPAGVGKAIWIREIAG
jgi:tRNA(Ile)-lysidine synthase